VPTQAPTPPPTPLVRYHYHCHASSFSQNNIFLLADTGSDASSECCMLCVCCLRSMHQQSCISSADNVSMVSRHQHMQFCSPAMWSECVAGCRWWCLPDNSSNTCADSAADSSANTASNGCRKFYHICIWSIFNATTLYYSQHLCQRNRQLQCRQHWHQHRFRRLPPALIALAIRFVVNASILR
jgi:hypothetical protein